MNLNKDQHNIISHLLKIEDDNLFKCIELLHYFIEKYPDAIGSSHNHQSFNGGYYKHISDILDYAVSMYKTFDKLNFKLSDVILVLFLHDIEKPFKYSIDYTFESDNDIRNQLIEEYKFNLTEEHTLALKYIHGEGEDYRKDKRIMSPLCAFCHCCDVISSRIFYN